MAQFVVTQNEETHVRYLVEADTADEAREKFYDGENSIELSTVHGEGTVICVEPLTEELPKPALKIIEAADTLDGRIALTIKWADGTETAEIVSENAARLLGYTYPQEA